MIRKINVNSKKDRKLIDRVSSKLFSSRYNNAFFQKDYVEGYLRDLKGETGREDMVTYISYRKDKILGFISFYFDDPSNIINNVLIIGFGESFSDSFLFAKDIYKSVEELICRHNVFKIVFSSSTQSPMAKTYKKLVKKYKGRECGIFRNNIYNGESYEDEVFFEIECSNLKKNSKGDQLCLVEDV